MFEVGKYGSKGLKISCNGTTLLTFEPSKEVCTGWSFWNKAWAKEKKKVTFTFDNVISFYSIAPYTGITVFKITKFSMPFDIMFNKVFVVGFLASVPSEIFDSNCLITELDQLRSL